MGKVTRAAAESIVPDEIIHAARKDALLRTRIYRVDRRRQPLWSDGIVVGFVTPHETPSGWRAGPLFVLPAFRGRGLVEAFYAAHLDRVWIAFIPSGKQASHQMHIRAGFVPWKRSAHGLWMRREARS